MFLEPDLRRSKGAMMSTPDSSERDDLLIRALAKQAYRHELLVKALRARGYLGAREPESLEDAQELNDFLKIFRRYFTGKSHHSDSGES
jgi:hypothetical protein